MGGAIIGDICGSIYEHGENKDPGYEDIYLYLPACHHTDDSILTIATADAILNHKTYKSSYVQGGRKYPDVGFGPRFVGGIESSKHEPYNSGGNGSAMRVGPIGYLFDTEKSVLDEATKSAQISHNHKDAITGAQVVAICIFLARHNKSKTYIKQYIENKFGYSFNETIEELRERNTFDLNCKVTVYCAIMCFLASHDFQSAIQLGLSIGGDADTICCIIGSIAEAYYKNIPEDLIEFAKERIDSRMLAVINKFYGKVKMNSKIKIIKK